MFDSQYRVATAVLAVLAAVCAAFIAATGAAAAEANEDALEQVVVTGSRLITDGSAAPTPVTVVSPDFLADLAPRDLKHALDAMPQFYNSANTYNRVFAQGAQSPVGNFLNLRGLGSVRTLILVDGVRVPATTVDGSVDSNTIPEMLVQRVDIVTGGASAAYGSDAVSGVVNYVLDRNFTGTKGVVQTGISSESDLNTYRVGAAYGGSLVDGRLRVQASAEYQGAEPIRSLDERPLGAPRYFFTGNGSAANPWTITANGTIANSAFGGYVQTGPFAGQQFLPGGNLGPFTPGSPTGTGSVTVGGDAGYLIPGVWLAQRLQAYRGFARAEYQLGDSLQAWVQGSYADSGVLNGSSAPDFISGITIFNGNAFLTPAVQAALGTTPSFNIYRVSPDFGPSSIATDSRVWNAIAGLRGEIFGDWGWTLTAAHGVGDARYTVKQRENEKLYAAIDAVRDPSGNIVCRVSITNPGVYPGCVPINLFGANAPSAAAVAWIRGISRSKSVNTTSNFSAAIHGSPLSTWAGPLGLVLGAEHRSISLDVTSTADPAVPRPFTGIRGVPANAPAFMTANTGVTSGSAHVSEAFAETSIPLARDRTGLHALEANLAGRVTDYSTSGRVTTWKVGVSWAPLSDAFRIRATRSSDIRAPDLNALFAGVSVTPPVFTDPHTNTTRSGTVVSGGNPLLQPEKADTYVVGFVYSPGWLENFTTTVDYYSINIDDAISTVSVAQLLSICEGSGGTAAECDFITRPLPFSDRTSANFPTSVRIGPINAAVFKQEGLDFEASYSHGLFGGMAQARLLGTWLMSYKTQANAIAPLWELAGQSGAIDNSGGRIGYPELKVTLQAIYSRNRYSVAVSEQYIGPAKQSLVAVVAPGQNSVPSKMYTAVTFKADFMQGALTPYLSVNNLFDTQPPLIPNSTLIPGAAYPTNQLLYDVYGRYYTAGVRFRF